MSGSNLFDNFLKTPIKKRCPFRESHENSKKAPLKLLSKAHISCKPAGISVLTAMISMKLNRIMFTFYPRISNIYPFKTGINKESVHFSSTFRSWYLKCTLTMAPPVGLEPTTCGLTVRRSTDWAKGECLCWHYLSSRAVTRQVLSAHMSLTSVFGMGTGGPSWQSIPTRMDGFGHLLCQTPLGD